MYANLHMHSIYSDGADTPQELCRLAEQHNIQVISITDHDSVGGQKALINEPAPHNVEVIPGIEISTEMDHKMIHVLGYYIDIFDARLEQFMVQQAIEKTESTRLNFEKARQNKVFSYEWERVLELNTGQPRVGGVHVVKAMANDGYEVPGMALWDMFRKCFWPANHDYISCQTVGAYEAIEIIKAIGGVPVIAHPKLIEDDGIVLDLIRHGAQGLEVYHPAHADDDTAKYLQMTADKRLYVTGGSDWHGSNNNFGRTFAMTGLLHEDYAILKLRGKN